jgi:hypothetical protein
LASATQVSLLLEHRNGCAFFATGFWEGTFSTQSGRKADPEATNKNARRFRAGHLRNNSAAAMLTGHPICAGIG